MTAKEREDYDNEWVDQQFCDWMKSKPLPASLPADHVADHTDDLSLFVGLLTKSFPSQGGT